MLIYIVDYDKEKVISHEMGDVANLDQFNREMDELFGDGNWYDDEGDANETLENYKEGDK